MSLTQEDFQALMDAVDRDRFTKGANIVFIGPAATQPVRISPGPEIRAVIFDARGRSVPKKPQARSIDTDALLWEAAGAGLNCAAFALTLLGTATLSATTVVSFGTTTPLLALTVAGGAATGAQCVVSSVRLAAELSGEHEFNEMLDDDPYYRNTMRVYDGISLLDGSSALKTSLKTARALRTSRAFAKENFARNSKNFIPKSAKNSNIKTTLKGPKNLNAKQRKKMTEILYGQKSKTLKVHQISTKRREEMLNNIAFGLSLTSSSLSGLVRDSHKLGKEFGKEIKIFVTTEKSAETEALTLGPPN